VEHSYGIVAIRQVGLADNFLVARTSHGIWTFPRGHAQPGESAVQVARREIREECGIREIQILDEARFSEQYTFNRDNQVVIKENIYYLGLTNQLEIKPGDDAAACRWVTAGEAQDLLTFQTTRDILKQAINHRRLHDGNLWA